MDRVNGLLSNTGVVVYIQGNNNSANIGAREDLSTESNEVGGKGQLITPAPKNN